MVEIVEYLPYILDVGLPVSITLYFVMRVERMLTHLHKHLIYLQKAKYWVETNKQLKKNAKKDNYNPEKI